MNVVAIVQARMSSNRLPGKVLKSLQGETVLGWVTSRLQQAQRINRVVVATSTAPEDDLIVDKCQELNLDTYRGSLTDVLSRFYHTAQAFQADVVVRICCDCPLIDPWLIDDMLQVFLENYYRNKIDYLSNALERTFPRGLDCEIFTYNALEKSHLEAHEPFEREHVTPYIYLHPDFFKIKHFTQEPDEQNHRWTLDTEEDYQFIQSLIQECNSPNKKYVKTQELLNCIVQNKHLLGINQHIKQKALQD